MSSQHKMVPVFIDGGQLISDAEVLKKKALLLPIEAAGILRVSKSHVYNLVERNLLEACKVGNSTRILAHSVQKIIESAV